MATLFPGQDTFVRGEISPRLHARASLELYRAGLAKCLNFVTLPHGGIRKRGGTYYVGSTKFPAIKSRLIPFVFSADQAYCLEFGLGYIRVYAYGARVGTVEVATPYQAQHLADIQFYQSADQMWLAHPSYSLRVLTRLAHESWTLEEFVLEDGPYEEINTSGTKLYPGDYGSIVPAMTTNSTPSGLVTGSDGAADAFRAFDKDISNRYTPSTGAGYIQFDIGGGLAKVVDAYAVVAHSSAQQLAMPSVWKFEGYNGSSWVTLDSRSAEDVWMGGEKRFYEFTNRTAYYSYRLNWSASYEVGETSSIDLGELFINEGGDFQTPMTLTADLGAGINDGAGFLATDVGRTLRLQGSDGNWRWARVTSYVNAGQVYIRLYGHALPDLSPFTSWRFGAIGAYTGAAGVMHASAVSIFEERLALASRFSAFLSKSFDLNKFSPGEADDDGLAFLNAGGGQANDITWIADGDGYLLLATTGGIRAISGSGIDEALTPSSFKNRRSRTHGASKIAPVDAGSSFVYVTRSRQTLAELTMNQYGRFTSTDMMPVSEHIPKRGINDLAYQENPDPVVWFTLDSGELAGFTYNPAQEVRGAHIHRTGEAAGLTGSDPDAGQFLSICTTPGASGLNDDVWVIVQREINGIPKRYIEMLLAPMDNSAPGGGAAEFFCVDCGLSYQGVAVGTATGMDHLEGEEVAILADSVVYTGLTISGGAVTLPGGVTATTWHVGLPFSALADTLELDVGGRDGSIVGRRKRVTAVIFSLLETDVSGLSIRSLIRGAWETVRIPTNVAPDGTVELFTGNIKVPIDDSWEGMGKIQIAHTNPTPITIRSMTPVFDAEP